MRLRPEVTIHAPAGLPLALVLFLVVAVPATLLRAAEPAPVISQGEHARQFNSPASAAQPIGAGSYQLEQTWQLPPTLPPYTPVGTLRPFDVAVSPSGKLYVADGRSNTLLVFDSTGALVDRWPAPPGAELSEVIAAPLAVDVAGDGTTFVVWQFARVQHGPLGNTGRGDALGAVIERRGPDGVRANLTDAGNEISDVAWDATHEELVLADPTRCALALFDPVSGVVRHRVQLSNSCAARVAAAGANRYVVVSSGGTARVVDVNGGLEGRLELHGANAKDVVGHADGSVALLVTPGGSLATAMVMRFDAGRTLQQTLTSAELRTSLIPRTQWPWALDELGGVVALSTAAYRFVVKSVRTGADVEVIGDVREDAMTLHNPEMRTPEGDTLAVATLADGRLAVLDSAFGLITAFDGVGRAEPLGDLPTGRAQDVAAYDGALFVSTDQAVMRLGPLGYAAPQPIWSVPCTCGIGGGRLFAAENGLWVSEARSRRIRRLDAQTGATTSTLEWPGSVGTWPSDIAGVHTDLYTAELMNPGGQRWVAGAAPPQAWIAGVVDGPVRLAASQLDDGSALMAGLFSDGAVQLFSPTFGQLLGRFVPEPFTGEALEPADIAIFPDGRLVLADAATRNLRVFAPGPPPTPVAEPSPTPPRTAASCTVTGDKWARPERIRLGDTATVTLTLRIDCPAGPPSGADVLLLVDQSSSMRGDAFERAIEAAVTFAFSVDTRMQRLGVIAFSDRAQLEFALAHDQQGAVGTLEGLAVASFDGPTDVHAALNVASEHLGRERASGRQPVIVLLSDGQYSGAEDPRPLAQSLRESGVVIFSIALGAADRLLMADIASSASHALVAPGPNDLIRAYRAILRRVSTGIAGQVVIHDEMGPEVDFIGASSRPVAAESARALSWGSALVPAGGLTFTYRIRPRSPGLLPTNTEALAWYTDADGQRRWFAFPVPEILVEAPTPTPQTSTPTASATRTATGTFTASATASATPTGTSTSTALPTARPSPTPRPGPLYLPVALRQEACLGHRSHVTVALVVDASSSMLEASGLGGSKLYAAQGAVRLFLDRLDLAAGDAASLVVFNDGAAVLQSTTSNRARLDAALTRMETRRGTRLDLGVQAGHAELSMGTAPGSLPVIILLTDGLANPVPAEVAVERAAEAKRDGVQIYTIGLGSELDAWALEAMASSPERFLRAPTAADLAGVYEQIAVMVPCDGAG